MVSSYTQAFILSYKILGIFLFWTKMTKTFPRFGILNVKKIELIYIWRAFGIGSSIAFSLSVDEDQSFQRSRIKRQKIPLST